MVHQPNETQLNWAMMAQLQTNGTMAVLNRDAVMSMILNNCTLLNRSTLHNIFTYINLVYTIPSMIYLKFLLIALSCGRNNIRYISIFYRLILFGIISALVVHIPHSIMQIISRNDKFLCLIQRVLSEPTFWLTPYLFITEMADSLRVFSATAIVLYRFHSIVNYTWATKLWEGRNRLIIFLLLLLAALLFACIFASPGYVKIQGEELQFKSVLLTWYASDIMGVVISLVCASIAILCQLYLVISGLCIRRVKSIEGIDRNLNVVGLSEIFLLSLYATTQTLILCYDRTAHDIPVWLIILNTVISDLLAFVPPWILLICSPLIREDATPFRRLFLSLKSRRKNIGMNKDTNETIVVSPPQYREVTV